MHTYNFWRHKTFLVGKKHVKQTNPLIHSCKVKHRNPSYTHALLYTFSIRIEESLNIFSYNIHAVSNVDIKILALLVITYCCKAVCTYKSKPIVHVTICDQMPSHSCCIKFVIVLCVSHNIAHL